MYSAIYCFDCDDTLAIPGMNVNGISTVGPVALNSILELRQKGIPTGICGNFINAFKFLPDWWKYFSFYGPEELTGTSLVAHHQYKHYQLIRIAKSLPAKEYIMVGNRRGDKKARPSSQDDVQAALAKWRFISETDFSKGLR